MTKEKYIDNDLWRLNAWELAVVVACGEVSALDVVDQHIPCPIRVVVDSDPGGLGVHPDVHAAVEML